MIQFAFSWCRKVFIKVIDLYPQEVYNDNRYIPNIFKAVIAKWRLRDGKQQKG